MMRLFAAAMAALAAPACAVPAAQGLTFDQSFTLSSPLSQDGYAAVESTLSAMMTQSSGVQTTAAVATQAPSRRLQAGTVITISYRVMCGADCESVATVRTQPTGHALAPYE
jgi:hypothetical protein|eukprot:COSAG03_NODE_3660_length_1894_cov_1.836212_2_plen_112_part_00